MTMKYCKKCVMPDTKPDLTYDTSGICDPCTTWEKKHGLHAESIDWDARRKEFEDEIVANYKTDDPSTYDCIVPVSGGKDSTYQVHLLKEKYGMRILAVCFEPTLPTEIGRQNLEMLRRLGVDLIHFKKNPIVYEKMVMEGLRRVGDNEWANHMGIFTVPFHFAVKFKIPLIVWGECPQLEYGGPKDARNKRILDQGWLFDYGGLIGNRPEDMVSEKLGITLSDLKMYIYPTKEEIEKVGIKSIWLGQYFKWHLPDQMKLIESLGWKRKTDRIEVTYGDFQALDCSSMTIHDYLKYVKYGFGRATDDACRDVRNGLIDREQAVRLVEKYDGKYPLGVIKRFCEHFKLSREEFDTICDSFTNKAIFETKEGKFVRDIDGSLVLKKEIVELRRNPSLK